MNGKRIFSNRLLFVIYGLLNVLLVLALLVLLILMFHDIYVLGRMEFIIFVGIHLSLLFFIRVHYLSIFYHEDKQSIEFHYTKRFGLNWQKRARTVLLPLKQFDGYELDKDSLGIAVLTFYKLEKKERYALGPFYVGFVSSRERKALGEAFGESL